VLLIKGAVNELKGRSIRDKTAGAQHRHKTGGGNPITAASNLTLGAFRVDRDLRKIEPLARAIPADTAASTIPAASAMARVPAHAHQPARSKQRS
jgi:hypothetical protein